MEIVELKSLTAGRTADLLALMSELDSELTVTADMLRAAVESPATHLFAAVDEAGHIVGSASLCVFASPMGLKATVEDVVVSTAFRGRHLGRALMEHILSFARTELSPVEVHLTSRPHRVAANALYLSLGFSRKETNVYILKIA